MSLLERIHQRVQRDYYRYKFHRAVARIEATPPVPRGGEDFTLLSMVHTRDVQSYLLALKSFVAHVNPKHVVVVCDPTITPADRQTLQRHVPHIELRDAEEFADPAIPRGGCWERLHAISTVSPKSYVIQLDADTVTVAAIPEVSSAVHSGQGFVLGEESQQTLLTLEQAAAKARPRLGPSPHIQTMSESSLDVVGLSPTQLYVRGCAGFTGFPRMDDMRETLLDFSARMKHELGADKWSTWGTEQVSSNFLVANAPGTKVLPFPKYATPDVLGEETAFLHFIGSMRFVSATYESTARGLIEELRK